MEQSPKCEFNVTLFQTKLSSSLYAPLRHVSLVCVHLAVVGVVSAGVWIVNLSLVLSTFHL